MNRLQAQADGPAAKCPRTSTRGFTLVELLAALALVALLVTLAGPLAVGALRGAEAGNRLATMQSRVAYVWQRLEDDIESVLDRVVDLTVTPTVNGDAILELTALAPLSGPKSSLHLAKLPTRVRYRLLASRRGAPTRDLIRESVDLTRAGSRPLRETIATRMTLFGVSVLRDGQWLTTYPSDDVDDDGPTALRITIEWDDDHPPRTRTFVWSDESL